jgi:hypothetical protein
MKQFIEHIGSMDSKSCILITLETKQFLMLIVSRAKKQSHSCAHPEVPAGYKLDQNT